MVAGTVGGHELMVGCFHGNWDYPDGRWEGSAEIAE
jgi:hypothetical protein